MSFQPPPPPAGPPQQGGAPLMFGVPATPVTSPAKRRSPLPWIIGAVVAVIVIVGVIVLLTKGGGDSGIDADAASDGLAAVIDDADFDETGVAQLRDCPLGDVDDLAEQVADDIGAPDELLDGDTDAYVIDESDALPPLAACSLTVAGDEEVEPASLYFSALQLSSGDDYIDAVEDSYGDGSDIEFEDPTGFEGGQIHTYCAEIDGDDVGCGADWVHDDGLVIGLSTGPGPSASDAEAALRQVVASMADALADEA